jgi:hypothetical protein
MQHHARVFTDRVKHDGLAEFRNHFPHYENGFGLEPPQPAQLLIQIHAVDIHLYSRLDQFSCIPELTQKIAVDRATGL